MRGTPAAIIVMVAICSSAVVMPGVAWGQVHAMAPPVPCLDCSLCYEGDNLGHKAFEGDETSIYSYGVGPHRDCFGTGSCASQHPPSSGCPGTQGLTAADLQALLDRTRRAIAAGDVVTARIIASLNGPAVQYVAERDAIEVLGCGGRIIAHFPLRQGYPVDRRGFADADALP